jgi:hypothetical protein
VVRARHRRASASLSRRTCRSRSPPPTAHLLDERYEGALTGAERGLEAHLRAFAVAASEDPAAVGTAAWKPVEALLRRLGWTGRR